jgi:alpha-methylacyl-CoA racemase
MTAHHGVRAPDTSGTLRRGPLASVRIVEFAGIGPVPYGAMLLADLGADVIRIDRPGGYPAPEASLKFEEMGPTAIFNRSRRTVRVDLKSSAGRELILQLVSNCDALIESYRPGTMERLGLGPSHCFAINPRLAYVRTTGWGQTGALADAPGHDLNYIGISGALSLFEKDGALPTGIPPLIGDMAAGGLFSAFGLLAAVLEARQSGVGQVVDSAIVDGSGSLFTLLQSLNKAGGYAVPAGGNVLDGGRHFYRTYRCSDRRYVAVGAIEPAFREALLRKLELMEDQRFLSGDVADDAYCTQRLAEIFAGKSRDHWEAFFTDSGACVTPVLSMEEAEAHKVAGERGSFVSIDGVSQQVPAPRFSRTPGHISVSPTEASRHDASALLALGFSAQEIDQLKAASAIE